MYCLRACWCVLLDGSDRIRFSNRRVWDVLTNVVFPRKAENFGYYCRFVLEFSALKLFDRLAGRNGNSSNAMIRDVSFASCLSSMIRDTSPVGWL